MIQFNNYQQVRDWLEGFIPQVYGKEELGLLRIENLLKKLGNPEKKFKSVHIGGTAGKGSTSFYIARLLENTGLKVGLHISPHLIYIGERMQILETQNSKLKTQNLENTNIPVKRLVGLVNQIKPVVDDIKSKQPHLTPSYFEILVAISFLYFAEEKVQWAVVEVGLGGRLDATNVLVPEISVITNIGLDHTELLGNTVEKIATEKAGIIKNVSSVKYLVSGKQKGIPVVTGATGKALERIKKVAKEKKVLLINFNTLSKNVESKTDVERYISRYYYSLRSPGGSFASQNKNLALVTVLSFGIKLDTEAVKKAFSVGFLGRFEEIDRGVIVDGAHNADKIKALIDFVRNTKYEIRNTKITLVVAFKQGKNWQEMIDLLVKNLPVKEIIATEYQGVTDMGRATAVDADEIAEYVSSIKYSVLSIKTIKNSQEAIFNSLQSKIFNPKASILLVTGSLYLVGEARTLWKLPEF